MLQRYFAVQLQKKLDFKKKTTNICVNCSFKDVENLYNFIFGICFDI